MKIQLSKVFICDICNKNIKINYLPRHLDRIHNLDMYTIPKYYDLFIERNSGVEEKYMREKLMEYKYRADKLPKLVRHYNHFKKILVEHKQIEKEDIDRFFKEFLPWKYKNQKSRTSKEMYKIIFPNEKEALEIYDKTVKPKNAFTNHGGKLSLFSSKCTKYNNLDENDKEKAIKSFAKEALKDRLIPSNVEYWINKGYSKKDAKIKVSEHQRTFTKEICIEKYGKEDGLKRWKQRQEKWQKTINSKSQEEINRINRKKAFNGRSVSKAEIEILNNIKSTTNFDIKSQMCIIPNKGWIYDLVYNHKIIEYNGDYWHCNPKMYNENFFNKSVGITAKEIWKKDKEKISAAKLNGYDVLVIWESDYKKDHDTVIQQCKDFLMK